MQILVSDPSYDHEDKVDRSQFIAELREQLQPFSEKVEICEGDIGKGASDPVIIAILAWTLFQSGKSIEENLDGWIKLAKRFGSFLKWTVEKGLRRRIDEQGASLLATKTILDQADEPIQALIRWSSVFIPFWRDDFVEPGRIDHAPDGLFSQTYLLNNNRVFVLVIKSTGFVESINSYPVLDWNEFR
ncbi:MAG: hypothetical protein SFX72_00275 [Isosphaeraceae bacterium]|nr:hypothetical protein [Isosphaeraceae bacterium]